MCLNVGRLLRDYNVLIINATEKNVLVELVA